MIDAKKLSCAWMRRVALPDDDVWPVAVVIRARIMPIAPACDYAKKPLENASYPRTATLTINAVKDESASIESVLSHAL